MTKQQLPEGWRMVKFGDIATQCKESVDRDNNPFERYVEGGHMVTENLKIKNFGTFSDDYVGPAFHRIFRKGQILYGSRRTYLKKVAVADFDGITANTTFVIQPAENNLMLPGWLPFLMLSDRFTNFSIAKSKGSTNPYINWKDITAYKCFLPPLDMQRRGLAILEALEKGMAACEEALDSHRFVLKKLLFEYLLASSSSSIRLGDICNIKSGQHIEAKEYSYEEIGVPYLTGPDDFKLGVVHPTKFTRSPKVMCSKGDVLLTVKGSGVGKTVLADDAYCISRQLMAISSESISSFSIYLALRAVSERLNDISSGVIPGITKKDVENFEIRNIKEDSGKLEKIFKPIFELEASLVDKLEASRNLRNKLLTELVK